LDKTPQEREKLAKELFTDYSQVPTAILAVRLLFPSFSLFLFLVEVTRRKARSRREMKREKFDRRREKICL
jgi:hypothetical protein